MKRRREEAANGCMVCFFLSSGKRNVGKMREAKYICFACGFMDVMVCLCLVIYALNCVFADMVELCYETAWVLS